MLCNRSHCCAQSTVSVMGCSVVAPAPVPKAQFFSPCLTGACNYKSWSNSSQQGSFLHPPRVTVRAYSLVATPSTTTTTTTTKGPIFLPGSTGACKYKSWSINSQQGPFLCPPVLWLHQHLIGQISAEYIRQAPTFKHPTYKRLLLANGRRKQEVRGNLPLGREILSC